MKNAFARVEHIMHQLRMRVECMCANGDGRTRASRVSSKTSAEKLFAADTHFHRPGQQQPPTCAAHGAIVNCEIAFGICALVRVCVCL